MMRRGALVGTLLAGLCGCEWVVGIHDKTLGSSSGDGGVPAVDGGIPSTAEDPSAPCAAQAAGYLFCDDFDRDSEAVSLDGTAPWGWKNVMNGGTMAPDPTNFVSPPRSGKFSGIALGDAQLGRDDASNLVALTTSFRWALDLRIDVDSYDAVGQAGFAQVETDQATYNFAIEGGAATAQPNALLQVYAPPAAGGSLRSTMVFPVPPPKTWTRIVLVYDKTTGVTVYVGGQQVGADSSLVSGPPGKVNKIDVGEVYINAPSNPVTFEIDNVVLRGT